MFVLLMAFFVSKNNGKLRLIIDARRANARFRKPPTRHIVSGSSFSRIRARRGQVVWLAQYDVKDFFYRLGIPWELGQYFGLPGMDREVLGAVLGPEVVATFGGGDVLHPYLLVLPMGFSWAFYLAQEALRTCVSRALGVIDFVEDLTPLPDLGADTACA